ncbi:hypothetical protein HGRIS_011897 [Hohenbuehelia grisea]|uniref:LysM domain-containing protein n=1 Tax=Hohenbuehelia grisea TaxID=104357 RepID=A0ABR3JXA6_9AGAR
MFPSATAAAILALPFLAQSAFAIACTRQYTIKAGDICDSISAANNVSTYQLAVVNNGIIDSTCSNLEVGKTICIGQEKEDCAKTYVVKQDDTCEQIASTHAVNTTILALNNPQIDEQCSNIYIGEVLCVSELVQVPPAPAGVSKPQLPGASIPPAAEPAHAPPARQPASKPAPAPQKPAPKPEPVVPLPVDDDDEDLPFCDEL